MTLVAIVLCIICQMLIVAGQVSLKHGLNAGAVEQSGDRRRGIAFFVLGIGCLTVWFFLWLGLMRKWDLSKLFPFEGLNPAIMAIAAWLILKERMSPGAWAGLALICVGIAVVAGS